MSPWLALLLLIAIAVMIVLDRGDRAKDYVHVLRGTF
jgi:hypothetical protein